MRKIELLSQRALRILHMKSYLKFTRLGRLLQGSNYTVGDIFSDSIIALCNLKPIRQAIGISASNLVKAVDPGLGTVPSLPFGGAPALGTFRRRNT